MEDELRASLDTSIAGCFDAAFEFSAQMVEVHLERSDLDLDTKKLLKQIAAQIRDMK